MKRYEFLGQEEITCICDFCGKKEIGKAFIVRDLETGSILYFGSYCIKKALQITMSDIRKEFTNKIEEIERDCRVREYPIWEEMEAIRDAYKKANVGFSGPLPATETRFYELADLHSAMRREAREAKEKYIL